MQLCAIPADTRSQISSKVDPIPDLLCNMAVEMTFEKFCQRAEEYLAGNGRVKSRVVADILTSLLITAFTMALDIIFDHFCQCAEEYLSGNGRLKSLAFISVFSQRGDSCFGCCYFSPCGTPRSC